MKKHLLVFFAIYILGSCNQPNQGNQSQPVLQVGKDAPLFSAADPSGKYYSLKDFKGKYVLLDFWASWCGPCRMNNPELVQLYDEFPKDKLVILSISVDDNLNNWERAIQEDGLKNLQLFDKKSNGTPASVLYRVEYIPSAFLIDPNGKILSLHPKLSEVRRSLKELM